MAPLPWGIVCAVVFVTAAALLACDIVVAANPDWRFAYWLYGLVALGGSLTWLAALCGAHWAFRFAPALGLLLFAIPWVYQVEHWVVRHLSESVALTSTIVANFAGIAAEQIGNTIHLSDGHRLGVERACSGIRSLQAGLMTAWFFGELMWVSAPRRALLLALAAVFALLLKLAASCRHDLCCRRRRRSHRREHRSGSRRRGPRSGPDPVWRSGRYRVALAGGSERTRCPTGGKSEYGDRDSCLVWP